MKQAHPLGVFVFVAASSERTAAVTVSTASEN